MRFILVRLRRGLTQGLRGFYSNLEPGQDLLKAFSDIESKYKFERIDREINFVFYEDYPVPNVYIDKMIIKWTGLIEIPRSDKYRFFIEADDGARVFLNDNLVIDALENSTAKRVYSDDIYLREGFAKIEIHYYNTELFGYVTFGWVRDLSVEEIIPSKYLYALEGRSVIISNVPRGYGVKLVFNGSVYEGFTKSGLIIFPLNHSENSQPIGEGRVYVFDKNQIVYESPLIPDMSPGDIYSLRYSEDT